MKIKAVDELKRRIAKKNALVDGLESFSTSQSFRDLLFSSTAIREFITKFSGVEAIFFTCGMLFFLWQRRAVNVVEKLLEIINEKLEEAEIKVLIRSDLFKTTFPQILEVLLKEVSSSKKQTYYKFFENFISDPYSIENYLSKMLFVLVQITPDQQNFILRVSKDLPTEYVKRNEKIQKTIEEATKEVWKANNNQVNFVLNGKYTTKQLYEIMDILHSYGITTGTTTNMDIFGMNGLTEFGELYIKYTL